MSKLELRVPPVVVVIACAAVMWLVARAVGPSALRTEARIAIAAALALAGLALAFAGIREFRAARTTFNPMHPEQAVAMVTGGIYRFTRNPMYLGLALLLLAFVVRLSVWPGVIVVLLFVAYMNRFQIRPEEAALEARFGDTAREYRRTVRRWI